MEVDNENLQRKVVILESNNEGLREQVNILKHNNYELLQQINILDYNNKMIKIDVNSLKKEKLKLLNDRSIIFGFSKEIGVRGKSTDLGKPEILKYILENIQKKLKFWMLGSVRGYMVNY